MTNKQGEFIWYELMTTDPDRAAEFYGKVVGWSTQDTGPEFGGYRLFQTGPTQVAGMMRLPEDRAGAGPGWFGYIGVDDVDRTAADVVSWGGTQHVPPTDIPGIGRFAMLADPQGIIFYIMRGASPERSDSFSAEAVGHCRWNELTTPDPSSALAFYTRLGFEKGDVMPMGEMGDYQFLNVGGQMVGALMKAPPGAPTIWTYYFGVDDIDRAAKAVTDGGGAIHSGPMEIPGGEFALVTSDPQGATVGFVGPRRS